MSSFPTLLRHVFFFHAAVPCLLSPRCWAMSTFCMLLRYDCSFHAAVLCLHVPHCCALSTLSTLLRKIDFSQAARLCLLFSRCYSMSPFLSDKLLWAISSLDDQFLVWTSITIDIKWPFLEVNFITSHEVPWIILCNLQRAMVHTSVMLSPPKPLDKIQPN